MYIYNMDVYKITNKYNTEENRAWSIKICRYVMILCFSNSTIGLDFMQKFASIILLERIKFVDYFFDTYINLSVNY